MGLSIPVKKQLNFDLVLLFHPYLSRDRRTTGLNMFGRPALLSFVLFCFTLFLLYFYCTRVVILTGLNLYRFLIPLYILLARL